MPISALRNRRIALGLRQQDVADKIGTTQTYYAKIEAGKVSPRFSTLQDIARALGLEFLPVPTELADTVRAMSGQGANPEDKPLFAIEPD
jgi:predicted transcriptional regulator